MDKDTDNLIQQVFEITRANIEPAMRGLYTSCLNESDISERGGIYAFWKGEKAVYVGRARDIRRRYREHLSCNKDQSPLASKFAKEALAKEIEGREGIKYLLPHYGHSFIETHIREEIKERLKRSDIKKRMEAMEFSFYEQENTLQQCLLEIFCSIELGTVILNKKGDEKINIGKVKDKNYWKYRFYNSFRTS